MKKNYIKILGAIIVVLILSVTVYVINGNSDDKSSDKDKSSGVVTIIGEDDGSVPPPDSSSEVNNEVTLDFDKGCLEDPYYYVEISEEAPKGYERVIENMQATKCFAVKMDDLDLYSTGYMEEVMSDEQTAYVNDDTPMYAYTYIYGNNIDYKKDVYTLLTSGEKIYPSDHSVINENEAYLLFEVNEGFGMLDTIILNVDGKEIDLKELDPFGCNSGICAY